jgi:ubiquinone/menaquinone biosynthesis C-methylase UbiE
MQRDTEGHYSHGGFLDRLVAALNEDGTDPRHPSIETLAPYDHFHGRGLEATVEIANRLDIERTDHVLDVGSGIGGPARYFADRFGCRVTGIDLTGEFCVVARSLTHAVGGNARAEFVQGDALAMPFIDGTFDGAYSMNVSMNIPDKRRLYAEIHRVLKRGGWLVLSELAQGPGPEVDYPTPWAGSARASFLSTPDETRSGLVEAAFDVVDLRSTLDEALAFGARSRSIVERGGKPPHRAVQLIHGAAASAAAANVARGLAEGRLVPIEVFARKR